MNIYTLKQTWKHGSKIDLHIELCTHVQTTCDNVFNVLLFCQRSQMKTECMWMGYFDYGDSNYISSCRREGGVGMGILLPIKWKGLEHIDNSHTGYHLIEWFYQKDS